MAPRDTVRFDDITLPRPGSTTLREVLLRAIPRIVRQYLALPTQEASGSHEAVRDIVAALRTRDSSVLVSLFRRPTVSCLVAAAVRASRAGGRSESYGAAVFALDTQVAFELACLARVEFELKLRRGRHAWPTLIGLTPAVHLEIDASADTLTFSPGRVIVTTGTKHCAVPLDPPLVTDRDFVRASSSGVAIVPGVSLALIDNNPIASVQLHPERLGNSLDLAGRASDEWVTVIAESLARVERYLPDLASEMRVLLQLVVPVGYDAERHFSCSYPDSIGAVYLSLHPNPMTMTEAIIHEFQHNKLHLLERLEPVLQNRDDEMHASPVRPDRRPLHGVLLAVHAFQPIARLYERMSVAADPLTSSHDWDRRFREVIAVTDDGARTLFAHARSSATGEGVLTEIRGLDEYFARYASARWPAHQAP